MSLSNIFYVFNDSEIANTPHSSVELNCVEESDPLKSIDIEVLLVLNDACVSADVQPEVANSVGEISTIVNKGSSMVPANKNVERLS